MSMRLLHTTQLKLKEFSGPSHVPRGYAILSHTWEEREQTYRDLERIRTRCKRDGTSRRDFIASKIRNCCDQVKRWGCDWVWIDSCCIDQENNAELSEAINSMFGWYVHAEVCIAYLSDVPAGHHDDMFAKNSAFRSAKWHTRGWILQELLAAKHVIFMSREWTPLGTKVQLSSLISEITGIREGFLKGELSVHGIASIAERMHWAFRRETKRKEDQAYCLLGLFDINMVPQYGEGSIRAFQRLLKKLVKTSNDASILLWGGCHSRVHDPLPAIPIHEMRARFHSVGHNQRFFLAQAPHDFTSGKISRQTEVLSGTPMDSAFERVSELRSRHYFTMLMEKTHDIDIE